MGAVAIERINKCLPDQLTLSGIFAGIVGESQKLGYLLQLNEVAIMEGRGTEGDGTWRMGLVSVGARAPITQPHMNDMVL